MSTNDSIDHPSRYGEISQLIHGKKILRKFYESIYERCAQSLQKITVSGDVIELGAGASFLKEFVPEALYSDVLDYPGMDRKINATRMELPDQSVRAFFLMNVFHHIPDVEAFLSEARRTLKPGGALLILDQYKGWLSAWIFKNIHHEPYFPEAASWKFEGTGPLSDANGALAWIVFNRDLGHFKQLFPEFEIVSIEPRAPLRYWVAGGLKTWSMLPGFLNPLVEGIDNLLLKLSSQLASFVYIEIRKKQ